MKRLPFLLLFGALIFAELAFAADKRIPTHEDIWLMKRVGSPQVSPDGRWIVVSVVEPSYDNDQLSDLWLVDTRARYAMRRLTSTRRSEVGVVWSPDSRRIVFSAQRDKDEIPQLYSLDLAAGGEAQRLTNLSGGARVPSYSHDGRHIAFVSLMYPGATDDASNRALMEARRHRKSHARIYDGFPVRNWDRWIDERQLHIFVQELDDAGLAVGPPRDLLAGTRLLANPGFAGRQTDVGEDMEIEFTPDDQSIVFTATANRDKSAYAFTNADLFITRLSGGEPRALTQGTASWSTPRFTRDGRTLLALVEQQGPAVYNAQRLAAFSWPEMGPPHVISDGLDRAVSSYAVSPDSDLVFFTAEDAGSERVFSVGIGGGTVQSLTSNVHGSLSSVVIPQDVRNPVMYAGFENASTPGEIALVTPTGRTVVITRFNAARAEHLDLPPIESFWFKSSRGKRIQSFIVRPPGFDPKKKYPLFVLIHGGPHGMWRDQFFVRWNYHLLAAPGYVLLLTNYSGSTGFGEKFAQSIQGDPFKGPADEINEAADAAIRQFGFIDGSRQCAGGASYGGHLANWLQGTTTRYKCLISHAGLVNLESQWGTSDTIYLREVSSGGPPWEQSAVWREQNPIRLAANFRTPVLVTVGEQDFRVPLNNSLEYWAALQRMRVPSRLIVFPDENHWIQKGENSKLFYAQIAAWLDRWLKSGH
ncbi:MAG TPA: S9 family peptidase [Steroidobacteraceae bacterium]|nr:S9 family peptidase [Steroidobacteraceae bacterium]